MGDHIITTRLCRVDMECMRRLMGNVQSGRVNLKLPVTRRHKFNQIEAADEFFSHQRDVVLKVAITPWQETHTN